MPGVMWSFERALKILWEGRLSITGCEINYTIFCNSAARIPAKERVLQPYFSDNLQHYTVGNKKEHIYLHHMDIFEYIQKQARSTRRYAAGFNLIWLDTTHTVISVAEKLKDIDNLLAPNCIFILTVLKGRERIKIQDRTTLVSNLLESSGLKLVQKIEYFDTSPMLHLIYTKEQSLGNLDQITV